MARGEYILTMDADLSHLPAAIKDLWECRHQADVVIGSRYVRGAHHRMTVGRTYRDAPEVDGIVIIRALRSMRPAPNIREITSRE